MDTTLSDFTDILDNNEDDYSSSPLSLSSIHEHLRETVISSQDDHVDGNDRPLKYTGQSGELRSVQEIPSKYRHLFAYQHFNIIQSKIMDDALYTDKSLVVSAPTGSGKTVVLEMTILQLLIHLEDIKYTGDYKIIYIAPVKALCTERLTDWYSKFTQLGLLCIQVTGDTDVDFCDLKPYKIIITTPEKWDMLTRRWVANKNMVEVIKLFMIDEVHLLNDSVRGPVLEAVVSRMKIIEASVEMDRRVQLSKQETGANLIVPSLAGGIRYVAISATVDNPDDVAQWLHNKKKHAVYYKMGDECRPVRLRKVVEGYPCAAGTSPFKFDMTLGYKLWPVIEKYYIGKPTLIFCSTRKSVCMTAEALMRELTVKFNPEQRDKLINIASNIQDKKLQALVVVGVGCHHAGYVYEDRYCMEQAFRNGDLPILVTTTTLAMGVNLPANLVIIKSTQQYINGEYQEYSLSTILQMMGRAGRPQFDTEGTAVIMTRMQDKARYTSMVSGAEPLESSLHRRMAEHLNSEIALGAVVDLAVAAEWARSTFLHVRATREPRRYLGLPNDAPPERVDKKIEGLCMVAINALSRHGMITFDEAVCVTSTDAGRLMSLYCLHLDTMKLIMKIKGNETLKDMLFLVCEGHELADSPLRVNEKTCLNLLNRPKTGENIRYQLKGKISTRQMKVNCILQSVFGCIPIPDPSLNQESLKILRIAERITSCIVCYLTRDPFLKTRPAYLAALLSAVTLAKCMSARLWEDSPHVVRQLRGIGPAYGAALATAGKTSFQHIRDANPRDLERLMNKGPPAGNILKQQVSLLPIYSLQLQSKPACVQVILRIQNCEQLQLHSGAEPLTAGPHHKIYLLAGDENNNLLMFHCFRDKQLIQKFNGSITKTFETVNANEHKVFVYCISATLVGLDVSAEITVQAQITPQKVQQNITKFFPTRENSNSSNSNCTNNYTDTCYYETPKACQISEVGQTPKMTELFKQKKKRSAKANAEATPTASKKKCTAVAKLDTFREQFLIPRATQKYSDVTSTMMPPLRTQPLPTKYTSPLQNLPATQYESSAVNTPQTTCTKSDTKTIEKIDATQNIKSTGTSWLDNISDSYSEWTKKLKNTHIDMNFEKVDEHFKTMINDFDVKIDNTDHSSNNLNTIDDSHFDRNNKSVHIRDENHQNFCKTDDKIDNSVMTLDKVDGNLESSGSHRENINVDFLLEQIEEEMKSNQIVKKNNSDLHLLTKINELDKFDNIQNETIHLNEESNIYENSADILRSLKSQYKRNIENTSFKEIMIPDAKKRKMNDTLDATQFHSKTGYQSPINRDILNQNNLDKANINVLPTKSNNSKICSDIKTVDQNLNLSKNEIPPEDRPTQKIYMTDKNNIDSIIIKQTGKGFNEIVSPCVTNIEIAIPAPCENDEDMFSSPTKITDDEIKKYDTVNMNTSKHAKSAAPIDIQKDHSCSNISKNKNTLTSLRKAASNLLLETESNNSIYSNDTTSDATIDDNISFLNSINTSFENKINKVPSKVIFSPLTLYTKDEEITKKYLTEKSDYNKLKSIYSEESEIMLKHPFFFTEPKLKLHSDLTKDDASKKVFDNKKSTENSFDETENDNNKLSKYYNPTIVNTTSHQSLIPRMNLSSSVSGLNASIEKTIYETQDTLVPMKPDLVSAKQLSVGSKKTLDLNSTQLPFYTNISNRISGNLLGEFDLTSIYQKQLNKSMNSYKQNVSNNTINSSQQKSNSFYESKIEVDIEIKTITMKEKIEVYRTCDSGEENKVNTKNLDANLKINVKKLCFVEESVCRLSQIHSQGMNNTWENQNTVSLCRNELNNLPIHTSCYAMPDENQGFSNVHQNIMPKYLSFDKNTKLDTRDNMSENDYFKNIPNTKNICEMRDFANTESINVNNKESVSKNCQLIESIVPKTMTSTLLKEDAIPNIHKNIENESLKAKYNKDNISNEKQHLSKYKQINEVYITNQQTTDESAKENKSESLVTPNVREIDLVTINNKEPVVLKRKPPSVPIMSYQDAIEEEKSNNKSIICINDTKFENDNERVGKNTKDVVIMQPKFLQKKLHKKTKSIENDNLGISEKEICQNESVQNPGRDPLVWKVLQKFQTQLQEEDIRNNEETLNIENTPFNSAEKQNTNEKKLLKRKSKKVFHIQDIHSMMPVTLSKFIDSSETVSKQLDSTLTNRSNSYLNTLLNPPIPKPGGNDLRLYDRPHSDREIDNDIDLAEIIENAIEDEKCSTVLPDLNEIIKCSEILLEDNFMTTHNEEEIEYHAPSSFKGMFERYSIPVKPEDSEGAGHLTGSQSLISQTSGQSMTVASASEDYDAIDNIFSDTEQFPTSEDVYSPLKSALETILPPPMQFNDFNSSIELKNSYFGQNTMHKWNKPYFDKSTNKKNPFDQQDFVSDEECYAPYSRYSEQDTNINDSVYSLSCYHNTEIPDFNTIKEIQLYDLDNEMFRFAKPGLHDENLNETHIEDKRNEIEFSRSSGNVCLNKSSVIFKNNKIGSNCAFTVTRNTYHDRVKNKLGSYKLLKECKKRDKPVDTNVRLPTWKAKKYITEMKNHFRK